MKRPRRRQLPGLAVCLVTLLSGCQSIHIRTGPPTDEEATEQSAERASRFRTEWANRLQEATLPQQAAMMRTFIDSTTARFIQYGFGLADQWRDEADRKGAEVPDADVRRMVEVSNQTELPLLEAYEDVLEYGIDGLREGKYFDPATEELLLAYRDHYLEVYSAVFYPNGTRQEFQERLHQLKARSEYLSRRLNEELERY